MKWITRNKWFLLGSLITLFIGYNLAKNLLAYSFQNNQQAVDIKSVATTWAIRASIIRIMVISCLFTIAYPVVNSFIYVFTKSTEYTAYIASLRYRLLIWYLVIEAVFALSHIG